MMRILMIVLGVLVCVRYSNEDNHLQEKLVAPQDSLGGEHTINIGVIVDMESWMGKVVRTCVTMALTDFYNDNSHYKTGIHLHIRDSRGDSLRSVAAALDLLETVRVHAMIVPTISSEELFMATLCDKANVPLLSFFSISSAHAHPYFLQVGGDEASQFHGIAALAESFKWKGCVILYEDTVDAKILQHLSKILQESHLHVTYKTAISLTSTNYQIINKLQKLLKMKSSIVIVHVSTSLISQVFVNAERLGMINKGFAWIVTSKAMDFLPFEDSLTYESMQGVLGFRSHISSSSKLQNFILRWRRNYFLSESIAEIKELNVYHVWAYDAIWALAEAVETAGVKPSMREVHCNLLNITCFRVSDSGRALLTEISRSKFIGIDGEFLQKLKLKETYEIVNVIGKSERRVGFWTSANGLTKKIYTDSKVSSNDTLDTIVWPGISLTTPESKLVQLCGNSLRVGIPYEIKNIELINWKYDQQGNVTSTNVSGYCVDVFMAAFDWLGYEMNFQYIPFNATYNDLVKQVYLQKCDVVVGDTTILSNRSEVDFTSPYTDLGVATLAKRSAKDPWFFTKPFDRDLWIMSALFFLITGFIIWLVEHPNNKDFQGSPAQQIGTVLWFAASTLVYAHRERLNSNLAKFVISTWFFVVLILTSSYIANLSSLLTVQYFKLAKGDNIGSANPILEGLAVSNLNFGDGSLRPYQYIKDYAEALDNGSKKKGGAGAIIDEIPYIDIFLKYYPEGYAIVDTNMTTSGFGFAFQKGSPCVQELSRAIAGLREEGKLLKLKKKWFLGQTSLIDQETQPPSLRLHNFFGLFIVSGISKIIAILIFVFLVRERLYKIYFSLQELVVLRIVSMFMSIRAMAQKLRILEA